MSSSDLSETLVDDRGSRSVAKKGNVGQRWLGLACCIILVEFVAGFAYAYGVYSGTMGKVFSWTDSDLATISSIADIGLYIAIDGGLLYDRCGPRITLIVGSVQCLLGYILIFLCTTGTLPIDNSVGWITVFFFIAFHGASFLDTAAVTTSIRNFSKNGALIVGLVKSFFGLSGSLTSQVYLTFFIPIATNTSKDGARCFPNGTQTHPLIDNTTAAPSLGLGFDSPPDQSLWTGGTPDANTAMPVFIFLGGASMAFALIASLTTTLVSTGSGGAVPALDPPELKKVYMGYGVVTALALTMAGTVVFVRVWAVSPDLSDHTYVYIVFAAIVLLLILLGTILVIPSKPWPAGKSESYRKVVTEDVSGDHSDSSTGSMAEPGLSDGADEALEDPASVCMEERTLVQSLMSIEFWLLFFVHFLGTGAGLMVINQCAQIAESYGDSPSSGTVFVTIVGTANALGRMVVGLLSHKYKYSVPLPMWYALGSILMGVGCAALLIPSAGALYVVCTVCGMAYGMFWTLNPTLAAEISGLKNLGANYAFLSLSPAAAGYAFNAGLASHLYDSFAGTASDGVVVCCGMDCFQWTGLVCLGTSVLGAGLSVVLSCRMRSYYANRRRE